MNSTGSLFCLWLRRSPIADTPPPEDIAAPLHKIVLAPKPPVSSRLVLVVLSSGDYPIRF